MFFAVLLVAGSPPDLRLRLFSLRRPLAPAEPLLHLAAAAERANAAAPWAVLVLAPFLTRAGRAFFWQRNAMVLKSRQATSDQALLNKARPAPAPLPRSPPPRSPPPRSPPPPRLWLRPRLNQPVPSFLAPMPLTAPCGLG